MGVITIACQTDAEVDIEDYKQLRFQMKVSVYEKAPQSERSLKNNEQELKFYAVIFSDYS